MGTNAGVISAHVPRSSSVPASVSDRSAGGVSIIDVDGLLTAESAAQVFRSRVRELLDEGARSLAINLTEVADVDSYGLGALAAAYNWIAETGGKIVLFAPRPRVRRTLSRLRLDSVFAIFDDERAALEAFAKRGGTEPPSPLKH